jgi:hypothetical protein
VAGDEKAGSVDLPAGTAGQACNDEVLSLPRGLTDDGVIEYRRLRAEHLRRFDQDMASELTRYWWSLKIDGPESFTWDRVRIAEAARHKRDERKVVDAARNRFRAELAEELQHADERLRRAAEEHAMQQLIIEELQLKLKAAQAVPPTPPAPAKSWSRLRVVIGSTLVAGCGTGATLFAASPDGNILIKLVLVAGTACGAAIWPKR